MEGSEILKMARALSPTRTDHRNRKTLWGGRMAPGAVRKIKEHHTSDPLAGMVRRTSTYSKKGGEQTSSFMTWRRASLNATNSKAWISSGVDAHHLADVVNQTLPNILSGVL